jgi:hypothetical protein
MLAMPQNRLIPHSIFLLGMVGVLLVAFWLRTADLDRYPPGVSNDEGVNVLDILHISRHWNFPLYEDLGRPEPLYRILNAAITQFFGIGVWSTRLTTAFFGMMTLAAAYWATAQSLRDIPPVPRRIAALLAAIALTIAVGHLTLSRALYRGILQPLFMLLAAGFVLRGLRLYRWRDFVLSGIFTALAIYSYTAAYFVPFAFVPMLLILALFQRKKWRMWLPRLFMTGIITGILLMPVILRLLQSREAVIGRAADVSGVPFALENTPSVIFSLFFGEGDQNPQYNADRAPLIPEILMPIFAFGVLALLIRIRQPASIYWLSLLLLCTIPVLLTREIPHGLRIMGEFAVFPVVIGAGVAVLVMLCGRFFSQKLILVLGIFLAFGVLLLGSSRAWQRYVFFWENAAEYRQWTMFDRELTHNEWFFRTDRLAFADWISQQQDSILLPLEEMSLITTRAWLADDFPVVTTPDDDFVLPPNTRLVIPWSLETGDILRESRQFVLLFDSKIILLPPVSTETHTEIITDIEKGAAIYGAGTLDFLGYVKPVPENVVWRFAEKRDIQDSIAVIGTDIELSGWIGDDTLEDSAQPLTYTLLWSPLRQMGHDYFAYVQLLTQDYQRIAGSTDAQMLRWLYPTTLWQMGDTIADSYVLDIPALAPGAYQLVAGVYPIFGENLPIYYPLMERSSETNMALVTWIKVPQPPISLSAGATPINVIFADTFMLLASEAQPLEDGSFQLNLYWQSKTQRPKIDATIFVHLYDESGTIAAQEDSRPMQGEYPTFIWDKNEIVKTEHRFSVIDVDNLNVRVGMYVFPGPQNLLTDAGDSFVVLGELARLFSR